MRLALVLLLLPGCTTAKVRPMVPTAPATIPKVAPKVYKPPRSLNPHPEVPLQPVRQLEDWMH